MFLVLDTNHYNELTSDSVAGRKAQRRIDASGGDVFISIIAVQEVVQGWLAVASQRRRKPQRASCNRHGVFGKKLGAEI